MKLLVTPWNSACIGALLSQWHVLIADKTGTSSPQVTYLFDDVGIPADYRHMSGSGVHTYSVINGAGKVTYVKFHWVPTVGKAQKPLYAYLHQCWSINHCC